MSLWKSNGLAVASSWRWVVAQPETSARIRNSRIEPEAEESLEVRWEFCQGSGGKVGVRHCRRRREESPIMAFRPTLVSFANKLIRVSSRACCPDPMRVGRAVPSAQRCGPNLRFCSETGVFVGALDTYIRKSVIFAKIYCANADGRRAGTARPTFWTSRHLGNTPSLRLLQSQTGDLWADFLTGLAIGRWQFMLRLAAETIRAQPD